MAWPVRRLPRRDSRQALTAARGHLDGRGAVVGGEVVPVREPGDVAGLADDGGGHDGADAGQCHPGPHRQPAETVTPAPAGSERRAPYR